jgi:hypothetical protein
MAENNYDKRFDARMNAEGFSKNGSKTNYYAKRKEKSLTYVFPDGIGEKQTAIFPEVICFKNEDSLEGTTVVNVPESKSKELEHVISEIDAFEKSRYNKLANTLIKYSPAAIFAGVMAAAVAKTQGIEAMGVAGLGLILGLTGATTIKYLSKLPATKKLKYIKEHFLKNPSDYKHSNRQFDHSTIETAIGP